MIVILYYTGKVYVFHSLQWFPVELQSFFTGS